MYGKESQVQGISYAGAPETRQAEVSSALERVNGNYEYLVTRLQVLTNRIQPVLATPTTGQGANPVPSYSCELAARIGTHADRLSDLAVAVDDVLNRLEI